MKFAITGTSMITSIGNNVQECFTAFCNGETGNRPLQSFPIEKFNTRRAYEIFDRPSGNRDVKGRATQWLCASMNEAIRSARLVAGDKRLAILIGTGLRELRSLELWWADGQPLEVSELHFGRAIEKKVGLQCPVLTLSNACAASSFALGLAQDLLELKERDVVIVAGCDSITESMFGLLDRVNPLHPEEVQPLDQDRRGVIMGEGAAALVLEATSHDNSPLAWLRGVGMSCDAYQDTAPHKDGLIRAMIDAHRLAGVSKEEIDLMFVHGTGTILNDQVEIEAICELFGDKQNNMRVTGLKSHIGHTSGASGLINIITAVECMRRNRIPPITGLKKPIEEASKLDLVIDEWRGCPSRIAQINAFGFGGVNAVIIIERVES